MDKKIHKIEGLDTITIVYYPAAATSRLDRGRWARRHTRARDATRGVKFGHLFAATTASMQLSVREQVRERERDAS